MAILHELVLRVPQLTDPASEHLSSRVLCCLSNNEVAVLNCWYVLNWGEPERNDLCMEKICLSVCVCV